MGDTGEGLDELALALARRPSACARSVRIDGGGGDRYSSYVGDVAAQVSAVCEAVVGDETRRASGTTRTHALGFSQGGQFARALVETCDGVKFTTLVTFGAQHLGVDALLNITSGRLRRLFVFASVAFCVIYAALLLKGAWDYWANFANLPQTTGRWFPTGFEDMRRTSYRAWYEVIDIPFPEFLRWIEPLMNEGETYEKLPRFIPYAMLPVGAALLRYRFVEVGLALSRGESRGLIVSHEVEQEVEDLKHAAKEE